MFSVNARYGRTILRRLSALSLALLTFAALAPGAFARADDKQKPAPEDPEVKLGRENAAENDKQVKLITDPAILERVNHIGQAIAAVANTVEVPAMWGTSNVKKFNYTFKVVDDKDVNAYSLPGGFIYVNKGLLDYVHSDDELAGVLGHEVAHAAHHHMMKLMKEQGKLQNGLLAALIVAAAATKGNGQTIGNAMLAGQLYMQAKLNTYGIEAEKDADQAGLIYISKTKYNPVGLLTFMERLAHDELNSPQRELGIFRTHPPSPDRAAAALAELERMGIPVNRREVDPMMRATVTMTKVKGVSVAEVRMYKTLVARLAPADDQTAEERGQKLAALLNDLFDKKLESYEVRLSPDKSRLLARYQTLVTFTDADSELFGATIPDLTQGAFTAVQTLLWHDQVNGPVSPSKGQ